MLVDVYMPVGGFSSPETCDLYVSRCGSNTTACDHLGRLAPSAMAPSKAAKSPAPTLLQGQPPRPQLDKISCLGSLVHFCDPDVEARRPNSDYCWFHTHSVRLVRMFSQVARLWGAAATSSKLRRRNCVLLASQNRVQ